MGAQMGSGGGSAAGAAGSIHVPSSDELSARTTENLIKEHQGHMDQAKEEEEQRRIQSRAALERKRTELRKKSGAAIKEHAKTRLEGGDVKVPVAKLKAQRG